MKTKRQLDLENVLGMVELWKAAKALEESESSLRSFVKIAWRSAPADPAEYISNWHIDCICDHLSAMTDGDIRKLIINMPPRCTKSLLVSVLWPAWAWIKKPETKWLFSSFDLRLSHRDSRLCRNLIQSVFYQRSWGTRFKLREDSNTLSRFDNDKMGFRMSTSSEAGTLGEGADFVVQDDPNDAGQMTSEAYIEKVIYNHDNVLSTRLNNPKTGCRLIVQQRLHERDLTGYVLEKESGWDHLVLPMEYEGPGKMTSIGWSDPRTKIGELLCPARFDAEYLSEFKNKPVIYAGQYQQRPSPSEGAKFKRHWWNFYNPPGTEILDAEGKPKMVEIPVPGGEVIRKRPVAVPPAFEQICHGYDFAFKDKEQNDLVSGQVWGRVGSNSFLLARETGHLDFPGTLRLVRKLSGIFPSPEKMIEDKANGPAVIQTLKNEIPGIIPSPIDGGLVALANSLTGYCEAGNWYLPNPNLYPWVLDFIEIFAAYPNGKHDDDVSACCHANRRLFDSMSNSAVPEFRVSPRPGEVDTACHVTSEDFVPPGHWRKWISVAPGVQGAVLWFTETPKKSLRVYRELALEGIDAAEAGRRIAEATLPDIHAYLTSVHSTAKWNIDILMDKSAFVPIEPIGCYAELLEQGILSYDPTDGLWEDRVLAKQELKIARFSTQMSGIQESAFERLRDLLRFKPADYQELPYDRKKAFDLSREDIHEYKRYMAAVEGKVDGEFPKIKFSSSCSGVIRALGASRRAEDIEDCFLKSLLLGISAPESMMTPKPAKEIPWRGPTPGTKGMFSGGSRRSRRFA
jgi:predicted phage terminase large subunit-like protein